MISSSISNVALKSGNAISASILYDFKIELVERNNAHDKNYVNIFRRYFGIAQQVHEYLSVHVSYSNNTEWLAVSRTESNLSLSRPRFVGRMLVCACWHFRFAYSLFVTLLPIPICVPSTNTHATI